MNAGAGGCVCGQVKLPSVMDPLQGLRKQPITSEYVYTAGIFATQFDTVSELSKSEGLVQTGGLETPIITIKLKQRGSLHY